MAHMGEVFEGRTLEDAVNKGLEALGLPRAEVMIRTLQEGSSGFLGIGARPYRVQMMRRPGGPPPLEQDREERRGRAGRERRDRDRGGRGGRRDEHGRDGRRRDAPRERGDERPRDERPRDERVSGRRDERRRDAPRERGDERRRDERQRDERGSGRRDERRRDVPRERGDERPRDERRHDERRDERESGRRDERDEWREERRGPADVAGTRGATPEDRGEARRRDEPVAPSEPRRAAPDSAAAESPEAGEGRRRRRRGRRGGRRRHGVGGEVGAGAPPVDLESGNGGPSETGFEPRAEEPVPAGEGAAYAPGVPGESPDHDVPSVPQLVPATPVARERTAEAPRDSAGEPVLSTDELVAESVRVTGELLAGMGFEAKVRAVAEGNHVDVTAEVERDEDLLTGRKGEVRQALQHLLNRRLNRGESSRYHLQLEINDFWKRREEELRELAHTLAEEAVAAGGEVMTEYLNAQERRIVHVTLRDDARVKTYALGTGMIKRVAIAPAEFEGGPRDDG